MTRIYDIIKDFAPNEPEGKVDQLSVSPYALVAIWRYRYPATFSRANGESFSNNIFDAIELKPNVLIITEDLRNLTVGTQKTSHITRMQCTIAPGTDYLSQAMPGDFCAAWMVSSIESFTKVVEALVNGKPANFWDSGFKFFGKVDSLRKVISQAPNGLRTTTYNLTANGFTELDASIYYEPYLQNQSVGLATNFLRNFGISINKLMNDNKQGLDINKIIPVFLTAFYGEGIPKNQGIQNSQNAQTTQGLDNPNSFIVPGAIAKVLGATKPTKSNGLFGWADVMETLYGIQKYSGNSGSTTAEASNKQILAANVFVPDGIPTDRDSRLRYTNVPMLGTYLPSPPQFTGQTTVWSIISQFLNPSINEMFCTLKANAKGQILPTLVVRQLPFSSGLATTTLKPIAPQTLQNSTKKLKKQKNKKASANNQAAPNTANNPHQLNLTYYMELPRWRVHPILVKHLDVGRSDALRQNFLHVYGDDGFSQTNRAAQFVRNPPIKDSLDVIRSGLRPCMGTVNASPEDIRSNRATDWMFILSDIVFGQHLTLNGSMVSQGIQSPICVGDNIEFDETVFHIEGLQHTFQISPNGVKNFTTSLQLTRGMKIEQGGGDQALYSGIKIGDLSTYEPGITRETSLDLDLPLDIEVDRNLNNDKLVDNAIQNASADTTAGVKV